MRYWLAILCAVASAAFAQIPTVEVTVRLVDRTSGLPVTSGIVRINDRPGANVDASGTAKLSGQIGEHRLFARALGYAPSETVLVLHYRQDTTVVVDLDPRPFTLDTVRSVGRTVKVKTTIRDDSTRFLLADVDVVASTGVRRSSGHTGLVTVDVPPGEPTHILFSAFGYLPIVRTVDLQRDTSFTVRLRNDPVAARMIARQVELIAERARGRPTVGKSTLNRKELMATSGTLLSLLQNEQMHRRVRCLVIDERPHESVNVGWPDIVKGILPDRVERVEVLERGSILRIYTREFVRDLMTGRADLKPVAYLTGIVGVTGAPVTPFCR